MAVHGVPRATGDLVVWVQPSPANATRVWDAMLRFGAPAESLGLARSDFETLGRVIQFGLPPRRVDLLTRLSGLEFDEAWSRRELHSVAGLEVPFLSRDRGAAAEAGRTCPGAGAMTFALAREVQGPHAGARIVTAGVLLEAARAVMGMCHGRGAAADDQLALARVLKVTDVAFIAPQAAGMTWYPYSFMAPLRNNEPYLSSALNLIGAVVETVVGLGVAHERVVLLGFSQGACLSLEYAGRNARRYGGVAGLSGGLIGPAGRTWDFSGSLDGTPVFLGCSDVDPHIPRERVEESAVELRRIGGVVDMRIYPGMGHTVNEEEVGVVEAVVGQLTAG
jgi:predicted esterase